MFKPVDAKSSKAYMLALVDERRVILETLDKLIVEVAPDLVPNFIYNMPGYGAFEYLDSKKQKLQWPVISIASQKNYVSVYVCALENGEYVAEKYKKELGKVSVGKSCIRFKKLEDVNLETLKKVIKIAAKNPGLVYAADKNKKRCGWVGTDPLYVAYHDEEWGVPVGLEKPDDKKQFEFLILEGAQAGLSWITVLKRREGYRRVFHDFDVHKVAAMTEEDILTALQDEGIIRNKLKVRAAVKNAQVFVSIQEEFGSFSTYMWQFFGGKTKVNGFSSINELPATSIESDALSKDLKKRGMSFVGSTIMYAHCQATGLINDHVVDCFRHGELASLTLKKL